MLAVLRERAKKQQQNKHGRRKLPRLAPELPVMLRVADALAVDGWPSNNI